MVGPGQARLPRRTGETGLHGGRCGQAVLLHVCPDVQDAITLLHIVACQAERNILTKQQMSLVESALADFESMDVTADLVDAHWNAFFEAGIDVDLPFRGIERQ